MHNLTWSAALKTLEKLTLVLAVLLLVIVFSAEITLRCLGYSNIYEIYTKPSIFWEYDSLIGWRHQKHTDNVFTGPKPFPIEYNTRITINSLGLRGKELLSLPQNGYRVLFLGDSKVAAFEVEQEKTFTSLLQKKLTDKLERPVQVLNAGVRGYGTDQSYLYLISEGRKLEPDLVVFMHSKSDSLNNRTLHRMKRQFGKSAIRFNENNELEVINYPVPKYDLCSAFSMNYQYVVKRTDTYLNRWLCYLNTTLTDHSVLSSFVITHINRSRMDAKERLRWLEGLTKPSKGKPLGIEYFNFSARHTALIIKAMSEAAAADQSRFLAIGEDSLLYQIDASLLGDVDLYFFDIDEEGTKWKNDRHYNERGHELIAEAIWRPIASMLGPSEMHQK